MPKSKRQRRIFLDHPSGAVYETCRIFPPVCVPATRTDRDAVFVYVEDGWSTWRRKRIGYKDRYPDAFVAWDDKADEWAIHQPGDSSIDDPVPATEPLPQRSDPTGATPKPRDPGRTESTKRKRRTLREWFLSKSPANEPPVFLIKKGTEQ